MNAVWGVLLIAASVFSCVRGTDVLSVLSESAMETVELCVRLAGGYALFGGILAILEESGLTQRLTHTLRTPLRVLFPEVRENGRALEAISENLVANMAGLGNAATPAGLRAMREIHNDRTQTARAFPNDAMCMLLVINATGVQLLPTGVIAMRAAAGSVEPASIVLPTLCSTALSTAVGVAVCIACRRKR